ncbi:MAG: Rrf2 family transcriptional regulator [Anaerolineaceae bacterium]|nr:Rrf2 family transcriptional regulator [Anaerolineaceae bacterium]
MIRISTRGRYALRALLDVARHDGDGPVSRQAIAGRQEISAAYVAQLFRHLQSAGLVEGVKGPGGGYRLGREAASITVADVVRAVEGPVALVACVLAECEETHPCRRADGCVTHLLWRQVSEAVTDMLNAVTLQDLVEQARLLSPW